MSADGQLLHIPEHRAQLVEHLTGRLVAQVDGMGEYAARAVAAVVTAILQPSLADGQSYRYLRDEIVETMPDPDGWDHDAAEPSVLADYVRHLATATRGMCCLCGELITAGELAEEIRDQEHCPSGVAHSRCL